MKCLLCGNAITGSFDKRRVLVPVRVNSVGEVLVPSAIELPVGHCCRNFVVKSQ
jgi:hypothetical protein